jgi:glucuronoarabinoxylan endo-1,4-beta-xylanase
MKTNGYASGGEGSGEKGKLKEDCYSKLFTWMNGFLLYMAQNKAPVDIVSVQNEPDWWVDYSGCLYSPEEMHNLVANYGGSLKKSLYKVRLMGSESLNHNPDYAKALLEDLRRRSTSTSSADTSMATVRSTT